jgi:hypothetical protein
MLLLWVNVTMFTGVLPVTPVHSLYVVRQVKKKRMLRHVNMDSGIPVSDAVSLGE